MVGACTHLCGLAIKNALFIKVSQSVAHLLSGMSNRRAKKDPGISDNARRMLMRVGLEPTPLS